MEREISIILRVRGAKQAKKAVQDIFNNQTMNLVKGFNEQITKAGKGIKGFGKGAGGTTKKVDSFTKTLGKGMAALYLYNRAWNVFGKQWEEGMQLERAGQQFEGHVGSVTKMLPELRTATRGIIADFDLLKTANRAFQQGLKPERMGKAFKLATVAAQRLGLQATDAINTITNAITKQDEGALNTLGIVTKVNQAYKTQAAMIAKNGGVMSKAMSIQLRQSLIMQELERRFGGVNKVQNDGLAVLERLRASWKNFRAELGVTIGIGLRPLVTALTATLDVSTKLLDRMNNTRGFQKFVQIAMTLGVVFGTMKFIRGARGLLSLFGVMGTSKAPKVLGGISKVMSKLGRVMLGVFPSVKNFLGALALTAPRLANALAFIPGWGTAILGLTLFLDPLIDGFKNAWKMADVFIQLLSSYDSKTGLSKVLKEDAHSLGKFYNFVENAAKVSLHFWAVLKGIGQGVAEVFAPVINAIGWASDKLSEFSGWLFNVDKMAIQSASGLDRITNKVKTFTKWIGFAASAVLTLINPLAGLAGMSLFGGALLKDSGAFDALGSLGGGSQPSQGGFNRMAYASSGDPQTSNQVSTPAPRAMNLEYREDQTEILKKMNKVLEKQTNIMEVDSQKQDIKNSQDSAKGNILLRR